MPNRRDRSVLPEPAEKVTTVRTMFDRIAPRYDLVNRLLTLRMDVGWRRNCVRWLGLAPGALVADLACGTGDFCRDLGASGYRPIGIDLSLGMLAHARTDAPLLQADATCLPLPARTVDGITCGFALRNLAAIGPFVAECSRVLRVGGRVALLEVSAPANPLLRAGHGWYFGTVVPFVGARLSDAAAYRYLPESVVYLPSADELRAALAAHGFVGIHQRQLSAGIAQVWLATRGPHSPAARASVPAPTLASASVPASAAVQPSASAPASAAVQPSASASAPVETPPSSQERGGGPHPPTQAGR